MVGLHAKTFSSRVEEPNKGKFDREVCIQNELGASPLFFLRGYLIHLKLPLAEEWHGVDNNPGHATTKVHGLMKQKAHQACRYNRVSNPDIPS